MEWKTHAGALPSCSVVIISDLLQPFIMFQTFTFH